ncbi:hypothetical protein AM593_07933, partial [Mytilus galloprovincialis]
LDAHQDGLKDGGTRTMKTPIISTLLPRVQVTTFSVPLIETQRCITVLKKHSADQESGQKEIIVLPEKVVPVLQVCLHFL